MELPAVDDADCLALAPWDGAWRSQLDVGGQREGGGQLAAQPAGKPPRPVAIGGLA
jgi:hypothetical protein